MNALPEQVSLFAKKNQFQISNQRQGLQCTVKLYRNIHLILNNELIIIS